MRASSLNKRLPWFVALVCVAVAACSPEHEIDRPGTWKPTGANENNLRAMVADQRDLQAGAPARTDRGNSGARAVARLLVDRRRPLLNVSTSRLAQPSDAGDGGGGGGPAAGAASP